MRVGLTALGHDVTVRPLRVRTGFHTFDRWLYNASAALAPPAGDVVVGVDLDGFMWARRRDRGTAARRGRVPYVAALKGVIADELTHERGWVRVLLGIQARWERLAARRADRVVVPSRYSWDVACTAYGIPRAKVTVIPEPIDVGTWRRRLAEARRRDDGALTVLTVARMYPRKRLADLLEATVELRRRIPGVRIRVVGKGPEFDRLARRHARLALGETVTLLGDVTAAELAVEYVSAQCFCLPSVQEAFGVVFAEAMAAGLPVVACRAAAVPEVVEDGRTGILVTPRRPDELAEAIATLLENRELRMEMGMAGRKRVDTFDIERVARRWTEVLGS